MYSKFGKVLAERFQILKHRDEILSGKVKKIKPPPVFSTNLKLTSIDFLESNDHENSLNEVTEENQDRCQSEDLVHCHTTKQKNSVAFTSQSRTDFYKSTDKKIVAPPCGHYDCKYSLVFKSVCVPKFKPKPKTVPRRGHKRVHSSKSERNEIKPKTRTFKEPFENQTSRPSITKSIKGVHEKRFIRFDDMPELCSKYKRAATPNMGKGTERGPLFKIKEASPDYKPSYKIVESDLGKVTSFDKYSARKNGSKSQREDSRVYKPNYALVEKRVCSPDFRKISSRPTSATPLPSYMKSANWRAAIELINEKSLEMNYSIDRDNCF